MTKVPLPRAVIFDWDNTLVDSWNAIMDALNPVLERFGKQPWTVEKVKLRCRRSARDTFPEWFGPQDWKTAYDLFYVNFEALRAKGGGPKARPGAEDLLRWVKGKKIPASVVSNKRNVYLRPEATMLGWDEYFVRLVGSGDTPHDKPARDPVDMALQPIGIPAGPDVWFIGDTDIDVQCARNAGCTPVFVGEKDEAEKLAVTLAFMNCEDLLRWVQTL